MEALKIAVSLGLAWLLLGQDKEPEEKGYFPWAFKKAEQTLVEDDPKMTVFPMPLKGWTAISGVDIKACLDMMVGKLEPINYSIQRDRMPIYEMAIMVHE